MRDPKAWSAEQITAEESIPSVGQVPGDLHPAPRRGAGDAGDLDAPALDVDHAEDEVADQARQGENLDSEKSAAEISPRRALMNDLQLVLRFRSGARSLPLSSGILFTVLREISWLSRRRAVRSLV